jgi:hypothetical protein
VLKIRKKTIFARKNIKGSEVQVSKVRWLIADCVYF